MNLAKDHYKKFTELYGQCLSEKDRPSLTPTEAKEADKENKKLLIAGKVHSIMVSSNCSKPRCVFAASSLASEEKTCLKCLAESRVYTCVSILFPPESQLDQTVTVVL